VVASRGQGVGEEDPSDPEQLGHLGVRELVVHGVPGTFRPHDVMAPEHREVLGEHSRLDRDLGQELADRGGPLVGDQDLQDPDPGRVGQGLEEVGLDLVERLSGTQELVEDGDRRWIGGLSICSIHRTAEQVLLRIADREGSACA
jgi:hypothetical protein